MFNSFRNLPNDALADFTNSTGLYGKCLVFVLKEEPVAATPAAAATPSKEVLQEDISQDVGTQMR